MVEIKNVGAIILAAGNSSRMKTPKPLLAFDTNTTFIQKIVTTYLNWGCNKVAIVTNKELSEHPVFTNMSKNCTIVINEHLEFERFYSAKLGAKQMKEFLFCFLQDADNPFTSELTLNTLFSQKKVNGLVIPAFQRKGGHPILMGQTVVKFLAEYSSDNGNLKEILKQQSSEKVEIENPSVLVNINTPEEYKKMFNF